MKKGSKRTRIIELTPEVLGAFDQDTLIGLVLKLYEQNKQLSEQLRTFFADKYGRKTERHENPEQLRIFSTPDSQSGQESAKPEGVAHEQESKPVRNKRPGHTKNPMPSNLRRERIRREPGANECVCHCGCHRQKVNEVVRNWRYECVPASVFIQEIVDSVWECPACHDTVVVAAKVNEPIESGKAGPNLLVQIAEDRWLKHQPLYRQEQAFARQGADIPRSTLCGWMAALSARYQRIYDRMKADLLKSKIISTDDTPVKVQDRSRKSNLKRGHEWIFMGDKNYPVNLFHYTEGRGRAAPRDFIPGFKGFIQGDCFSGNQALCAETGATLVACRAHDRRYYKKALQSNKKLCTEMLDMYQELFEIEQTARDLELTGNDTLSLRQQEAVPLLAKMKAWIDEHALSALPASSFGKAIQYSLNNWEALNNYLLDGDLRADNNLAEQQMKVFATGRKNWYFFGSDEAGKQASIMLSLFSTCLRSGVEPRAYLLDTLNILTADPNCDIENLLPHTWSPDDKATSGHVAEPTVPAIA